MSGIDDKVQIGSSSDFLEGVSVDTSAGNGLFREGVVVSDPESAQARQRVTNTTPAVDDFGAVVRVAGLVDTGLIQPTTPTDLQPVDVLTAVVIPKHVTTASSGETVIVTPASGKAIRLWWYSLTANADNSSTVVAGLRFGTGSTEFFKQSLSKFGQGTAHSFKAGASYHQGLVDQPLIVNLDAAQTVYVNIDYEEVTL